MRTRTHKQGGGRVPGQRGLAIVEFTIVLPLLLFLFLAVAEFGRAFLQYNLLTHAVRDSARFVASKALLGQAGSVNLDAATISQARSLVVYGNVGSTGSPLLPGLATGNVTVSSVGGGNIAVLATYPYQPMIGAGIPDLVGVGRFAMRFNLSAEVVIRAISSS
jgi:Flp pilus assembly protein TadG